MPYLSRRASAPVVVESVGTEREIGSITGARGLLDVAMPGAVWCVTIRTQYFPENETDRHTVRSHHPRTYTSHDWPTRVNLPGQAWMPSPHVCSKLVSPRAPQFLNQAPPRAQQLYLPDFGMIPHLGHAKPNFFNFDMLRERFLVSDWTDCMHKLMLWRGNCHAHHIVNT